MTRISAAWIGRSLLVLALALVSIASQASTPSIPIRLAFPSVGTLISGQVGSVLQHTTILKEHQFSAEITPMPLGKELKAALIAGQVDVIFTSEANFVVLLGEGFDCYAISSLGGAGEMALVVKPGSRYEQVSDLRGKKVATIFGTSIHEPAIDWLKQGGLEPGKDVTLVNMRGMGPMNAAFESGGVEGLVTFDPYLLEGLKNNQYRVLKKTNLDLVVVMSGQFAKSHPGVIVTFNSMLRDAAFYMATHKADANRWAGELSGMPVATLDEGSRGNINYQAKDLDSIDLKISPRFRDKLTRLSDFFYAEKLTQKKVAPVDFIRDEFAPKGPAQ